MFELPVLSEKDVHWNRAAMTSSCVPETLLTWRQSRLGRKLEEDVLLECPMALEWNDKRVKYTYPSTLWLREVNNLTSQDVN